MATMKKRLMTGLLIARLTMTTRACLGWVRGETDGDVGE
jgi:hypothetical protein